MEQTQNENVVIDGFSPEWYAKTEANDGGGFARHPYGDYRVRVKDVTVEPSKGANPHNMLVVTFETISVIGDGDPTAVGMTQQSRYGTPQSPKFMQQRAKQFLSAIDVRGPFSPKSLIGRELDVTVTWDKSAPVVAAETGEEKIYVNSRVAFERKAGTVKPPKANAKTISAAAIKYLQETDSAPDETDATHEAGAWEQSAQTAAAAQTSAAQTSAQTGGWLPDDQIPENLRAVVDQYRAVIALAQPQAGDARTMLASKRFNPDGPVANPAALPEALKAAYLAHAAANAPKADSGLPSLDLAPVGNGATATKPKTGTRTKQPSA